MRQNDREQPSANVSRRQLLHLLGLGAASVPLGYLAACADDAGAAAAAGASAGGAAGASAAGAGGTTTTIAGAGGATTGVGGATAGAAGAEAGAAGSGGAQALIAWATGGTASMTDKANYPNPFDGLSAANCGVATCVLTEGPCYDASSEVIQDISYGYAGLPMRLVFRLLDTDCNPVKGASVDVWHVGPTGKYSGDDGANEDVSFCTANDPDFTSHLYFRGRQTSDDDGVVSFDSCFPGWYSSRAVHIHFTIRIGDDAYLTSQFNFDDAFLDSILLTQALYDARGARDTTNSNDGVFSPTDYQEYEFQTQPLPDGAVLVWKQIILRKALTDAVCGSTGAGMGPGGPMGGGGAPPGLPGTGGSSGAGG